MSLEIVPKFLSQNSEIRVLQGYEFRYPTLPYCFFPYPSPTLPYAGRTLARSYPT